ncbi:Sel1-like repeat-containing protein kinase family protein [Eggerthella lenta]|jgi:TPR repeat protein|uniref:Sel1-like repeat-containing protein kinase family protein n=1 Tax=Eggerthella lenta TaxID=84112 RepID=UPI001C704DB5|nr:Sel1-like repeat-containing protein kinase family protein [Eggerthella lenta]
MASFIGDDETVWNEGRIKGFENGSSGTYGFLSAVTWSSRTLIAKGIKTEVFGAKVAEAIRDREFKRLELANGLAGCAPEVRGKGELVLESGDRYPALLMNHIPGRSLSKALDILAGAEGRGLSAQACIMFARQLLVPFLAMERAGFIHGDLHPGNFRVELDEAKPALESSKIRLVDFGNARHELRLTPTPAYQRGAPGSFAFESPESFSCELYKHFDDCRSRSSSNMWAFGALLYYARTRGIPHQAAAERYGTVWNKSDANEEERRRALKEFIEGKLTPLVIERAGVDNLEDFRLLVKLIRMTMEGNPRVRWTAEQCQKAIQEHLEKKEEPKLETNTADTTPHAGETLVQAPILRERSTNTIDLLSYYAAFLFAHLGLGSAELRLGLHYWSGRGVERDEARAADWWRKAAEHGNAMAQFNLGWCYQDGYGVERDDARAAEWYRKAAEQGNARAQNSLGSCYWDGRGVEQDYAQAAEWYRKAAEQGNARAQFNLGLYYWSECGVERDDARAAKWFRKAAEQGDTMAQNNLGFCYIAGRGVEEDDGRAVEWWRKAAERGEAVAQNNLGWCYQKGYGVEQDYAQAVEWYRKAAEQGNAKAIDALSALSAVK